MSAPRHPHETDVEALLEDLARADDPPHEIARRHGLSPAELTRWAATPEAARLIDETRRLADDRAAMAVSRARVAAAHALHRLALDAEHPETARKACVDLLKLEPRAPAPDGGAEEDDEPDASGRDAVRSLLERLESRIADEERA